MKVRALFFASIRDAAGCGEAEIDVSGGALQDALDEIHARFPGVKAHAGAVHIALNEEYATLDTPVHEGDTLALIPPVSGGSR